MATKRRDPYVQFNFLVDLGNGVTEGPDAGFQEIAEFGLDVTISPYRNGNDKDNGVRKIVGLNNTPDVTLKRGIIGSLALYQWLDQIRNGDQRAARTVVISLQNEARTAVAQSWKLLDALITSYKCGPFNARGNDVAIETIVLASRRLVVL